MPKFPFTINLEKTEKHLQKLTTEESIMNYAKNMRKYAELGIIIIPASLKYMVHKRLDQIIENF